MAFHQNQVVGTDDALGRVGDHHESKQGLQLVEPWAVEVALLLLEGREPMRADRSAKSVSHKY